MAKRAYLDWVHSHSRKRFRISVAMMELVNVSVNGSDVQKSVCNIKVDVSPDWDHDYPKNIEQQQVLVVQNVLPSRKFNQFKRPESAHHSFPPGPLQNPKAPVVQIVCHISECWVRSLEVPSRLKRFRK